MLCKIKRILDIFIWNVKKQNTECIVYYSCESTQTSVVVLKTIELIITLIVNH